MKQVTAILIGAGARGQIYAEYAKQHPDELKIVAVADPRADRRRKICDKYGVDENAQYESWAEILAQPQMADAALVCTLDNNHAEPAILALKRGYHVLLEKPMSNREDECRAIAQAAKESGKVLSICHVLRYTPFYQTVKGLIDAGELGEVASIDQIENVAYWHFAHSFVRGNWRNEAQSSSMILQKSCHDMDILIWLMGKRCESVTSFGSMRYYNEAHAPAGAPARCTDGCPHSAECVYDARKIYLNGNVGWPTDMLTTDLTPEGIEKALREGPYGRCVYHCDNDVNDRQVVNLEFEGGGVATFTLSAFTTDTARQLKITGTKAQLTADMNTNKVILHRFGEKDPVQIPVKMPEVTNNYGHGGGDYYLMRDFVRAVQGDTEKNQTDASISLQSHLICFAAERSRKNREVVALEL